MDEMLSFVFGGLTSHSRQLNRLNMHARRQNNWNCYFAWAVAIGAFKIMKMTEKSKRQDKEINELKEEVNELKNTREGEE